MIARSYWEATTYFKHYDVAIIGSGFMGLWTALELLQRKPSLQIAIIDGSTIPTGASTRNAGFACFGSPTELLSDIKTMGEDKMWSIVEMRFKGIEKIKQYFDANNIDFEQSGGYELYQHQMHDIDDLQDAVQSLNKGMQQITGHTNSFVWSNDRISSFGFSGFDAMIGNAMEGGLHSGKLLQALTKYVTQLGAHFFYGTTIQNVHINTNDATIYGEAFELTANKIVCTINGFTSALIKDLNIEPVRGQVLVTSPIEALKWKGTFHYDSGYYYFRNIGNRVLLGGARNVDFKAERTTALTTNADIQSVLESFLSNHILPDTAYTIEYQWAGLMGFTADKLPLLQAINNHVCAAVICNGMGVALSPIMAEKAAEMLLQ